jgi:formate hydrogenlyase subunit 3/multisubunit Na+/H+ antiporter MnhD subunit
MNPAHIHLLVNHLPIIGQFFSVFLVLVAFYFRQEEGVLAAAVTVMLLSALGAVAAFLTGSPAIKQIATLPGIAHQYINLHYKRAKLALLFSIITALVGVFFMYNAFSKTGVNHIYWYLLMLFCAGITAIIMIFTGNVGGKIHHPEIREKT